MRKLIPILLVFFGINNVNAQFCGNHEHFTFYGSHSRDSIDCGVDEILVPIYIHDFGSGFFFNNPANYQELIDKLNFLYTWKELGEGSIQYTHKIRFVLATLDENEHCFPGYKRHTPLDIDISNINIVHDVNFGNVYTDIVEEQFILDHYLNVSIYKEILGNVAGVYPDSTATHVIMEEEYHTLDEMAYVLAHEIGHFMSLNHPFEFYECIDFDGYEFSAKASLQDVYDLGCTDGYTSCDSTIKYDVSNIMSYAWSCIDSLHLDFHETQLSDGICHMMNEWPQMFTPENYLRVLGSDDLIEQDITLNGNTYNWDYITVLPNSTITIEGNVVIENSTFQMGKNTKIVVSENASLTIRNSTITSVCSQTNWHGIESFGNVRIDTRSRIDLAETGVLCKDGSLHVDDTEFNDCITGIQLGTEEHNMYATIINPINNRPMNNVTINNSSFNGDVNHFIRDEPDFRQAQYGIRIRNMDSPNFHFSLENNSYSILRYGLYADNLKHGLTSIENTSINVYYPIFVEQGNRNAVMISSADLNFRITGVHLYNCYFAIDESNFVAHNQRITQFAKIGINLDRCYGIYGRRGSDINNVEITGFFDKGVNSLLTHRWSMKNSTIYHSSSASGIGIETLFNVDFDVEDNFIIASRNSINSSYYMGMGENSIFGNQDFSSLTIEGGLGQNIFCNLTDVTFKVNSSPYSIYHNNDLDESSLEFAYRNAGARIQDNNIDVLALEGGANSNTIISPQKYGGNVINIGEYNTDLNNIDLNAFFVGNSCVPSANVQGWIITNNSISCDGYGFSCVGGSPGNSAAPPWNDDRYNRDCLDSLFNSTRYAHLSSKAKWSLLFNLYRVYKKQKRDFPFNLSDCAKVILTQKSNEDIGQLDSAITTLVKWISTSVDSTVQINMAQDASLYLYAIRSNDTVNIESYANSWGQTLGDLNQAMPLRNTSWTTQESNLTSLLTQIVPTNAVATYHKQVLEYLVTVAGGGQLSPSEESTLADIAQLCDENGGDARFMANHLYYALTGQRLAYQSCNGFNLGRIAQNQGDQQEAIDFRSIEEVSIHPNPSTGIFMLQGSNIKAFEVLNYIGEKVSTKTKLSKDAEIHTIDMSEYSNGVYYFVLYQDGQRPSVHKIIKI